MLEQEDPTFPNWDQDAAAVEGRYAEQLPLEVAGELMGSALALAGSFEAVPPGSWGRTGTRRDRARFRVESLARYLVHDPVHHLYDVGATPPEVGYR